MALEQGAPHGQHLGQEVIAREDDHQRQGELHQIRHPFEAEDTRQGEEHGERDRHGAEEEPSLQTEGDPDHVGSQPRLKRVPAGDKNRQNQDRNDRALLTKHRFDRQWKVQSPLAVAIANRGRIEEQDEVPERDGQDGVGGAQPLLNQTADHGADVGDSEARPHQRGIAESEPCAQRHRLRVKLLANILLCSRDA